MGVVSARPALAAPGETETPLRALGGRAGRLAGALAVALAVYGLYWVLAIIDADAQTTTFQLRNLALTTRLAPAVRRPRRQGETVID